MTTRLLWTAGFVLTFGLHINTPSYVASEDYSLQSLVARVLSWGARATEYSQYRWQGSRDELKDSVIGATIRIEALPIAARRISVTPDRRAVWRTRASLADGRSPDGLIDIALPAASRANIAGTSRFGNGKVSWLDLSVADVTDRLAMEVTGEEQITVIGRIRELDVDISAESVALAVDIISWNRGGPQVEPEHARRLRADAESHLARGDTRAALTSIDDLLRLLPADREALQWRESLVVVGSFPGLPHDHGADGVISSLFGQKSVCTGTLIVRKGFVEFQSAEHPGFWRIGAISAGQQLPLKGFALSDGRGRYRFMVDPHITEAVLAALQRAQAGR